MGRLRRQIASFGVGGAIGFVVDAGVVQLLVSKLGADPYVGRVFSFLCAATVTWLFNRRFTFRERGNYGLFGEWGRYLIAMSAGFAVNYATYALVVYFWKFAHAWPALGVAAGSLPGALVNFLGARHWVFSRPRAAVAEGSRDRSENKP
ncbi:MAG TPA: GtrA family protein [Rhodanobacteraceae bacterium]|jgi:putative flippase GtrA|nr:GtrA family protein [Rhodanobacteraceae bacterium]